MSPAPGRKLIGNLALLTLVRRAIPSPIAAQLIVILPIAALSYCLLSIFVFDRLR
jgi:hypothetical protein